MAQRSEREWRQFAEARSLDPVTGKKYPPRLDAEWVSHRYSPRPKDTPKPNSALKSLLAHLFGA
jgi:hypothetical protein